MPVDSVLITSISDIPSCGNKKIYLLLNDWKIILCDADRQNLSLIESDNPNLESEQDFDLIVQAFDTLAYLKEIKVIFM